MWHCAVSASYRAGKAETAEVDSYQACLTRDKVRKCKYFHFAVGFSPEMS